MRASALVADVRREARRHRMTNATQKSPRDAPTVRVVREMRSLDADKSAARRELRTLDEDRIVVLRTMLERTPDELRVQGFNPETVYLVRQVQEVQRGIREQQERYTACCGSVRRTSSAAVTARSEDERAIPTHYAKPYEAQGLVVGP
jgi:hypothetical protein